MIYVYGYFLVSLIISCLFCLGLSKEYGSLELAADAFMHEEFSKEEQEEQYKIIPKQYTVLLLCFILFLTSPIIIVAALLMALSIKK